MSELWLFFGLNLRWQFKNRFAQRAEDIAETLDIPLNSVSHLAKQPEWDTVPNTLQYAGERTFKSEKRRDTLRDSGDLVARPQALPRTAMGQPHA